MKRVLVLGAGRVARPLVAYMERLPWVDLTLGTLFPEDGEKLLHGLARGKSVRLDARDEAALGRAVGEADLVVSLLPATEHLRVARACLAAGRHMATASYAGPEIRALDEEARRKGIVLLNECGLDPGLDHMSAVRMIRRIHASGGKVLGFHSWCGGLPAPEANTNPIGYKLSWSPEGVLSAAVRPARYLRDGDVVEVPGEEIFLHPREVRVPGLGVFEGYPNGDSLPYRDAYDLGEARDLVRGTLRNPGHCEVWSAWVRMGLLDGERVFELSGRTWKEFSLLLAGAAGGDPREVLARKAGLGKEHPALRNLEWLGFFREEPLPLEKGTARELLAERMKALCRFEEGERDMVVLQHEFRAAWPGGKEGACRSRLAAFGEPGGDTAMARTVSLPLAAAVKLLLSGEVEARGVLLPVEPRLYEPVLRELEEEGIRFQEEWGGPDGKA